ncbi:MAG: hypothetical protein U1F68_15385 [Gammaproteobacteria bacterium]
MERHNGHYLHHDGGVEKRGSGWAVYSIRRMRSSARWIINHDAIDRIKRLCRQQAKAFIMLRSDGYPPFSRALADIAA